jgi:hypothetical protein
VLLLVGVSTGFVRVPLQRCLAAQVDSHSASPMGGERGDGVLANDGLRAAWMMGLHETRESRGGAAIAELSLPGLGSFRCFVWDWRVSLCSWDTLTDSARQFARVLLHRQCPLSISQLDARRSTLKFEQLDSRIVSAQPDGCATASTALLLSSHISAGLALPQPASAQLSVSCRPLALGGRSGPPLPETEAWSAAFMHLVSSFSAFSHLLYTSPLPPYGALLF